MKDAKGMLFHAKHAYMPNRLGYCGPDDRGVILEYLEESRGGEGLEATLKEFEAAYPFLTLIARSTGREAFDYSVPEAYWIGNRLLESVPQGEFARFSHRELKGRDEGAVMKSFRTLRGSARPNHTFYVLSTFAGPAVKDGPDFTNESARKVLKAVDDCRVSWGVVKEVGRRTLKVQSRALVMDGGPLSLGEPAVRTVGYDPLVKPFSEVKPGAVVSLHWDHACEVLTLRQARNIEKYTRGALASANELLRLAKD